MKLGYIGLGKMGSQMVERLLGAGHEIVVTDVDAQAVEAMVAKGAQPASGYADMAAQLGDGTVVWLMIPEQFVGAEIEKLAEVLKEGSIVIDGGNSDYRNTLKNSKVLAQKDIELIDVGTSGGVWGLKKGFSMMIGGNEAAVAEIEPIIVDLAQKDGWGRMGEVGSGHFTKMVHNGIEYGVMQAFAEGYRVIKEGPFESVDLSKLAGVWQHGSINESFLNGLMENMLARDSDLGDVEGYVHESGEARWTLETAKELGIETPVIQAAFDVRLRSQEGDVNYATRFLAQLRNEFGGHAINKEE